MRALAGRGGGWGAAVCGERWPLATPAAGLCAASSHFHRTPRPPPATRRRQRLEQELQAERLTPEQRAAALAELERRESDYSRLQRQRLSVEDFEPLKLIGKGAFGEVRCAVQRWAASWAGLAGQAAGRLEAAGVQRADSRMLTQCGPASVACEVWCAMRTEFWGKGACGRGVARAQRDPLRCTGRRCVVPLCLTKSAVPAGAHLPGPHQWQAGGGEKAQKGGDGPEGAGEGAAGQGAASLGARSAGPHSCHAEPCNSGDARVCFGCGVIMRGACTVEGWHVLS